jgi:hypothetical protein
VSPITVKVLPVRAWHCVAHDAVLACFVLKEADAVKEVIGRARAVLRCLVRNGATFEDVLGHHPDPVTTIVKALYFCLQERYGIAYGREPRYYGTDWQAVRFPADVLDDRNLEGTCIDLALLLAACLENRSLSPVIVLVKTATLPGGSLLQHALVGCWTGPSPRSTPVETDGQQMLSWLNTGALVLLDPVGFAHGEDADQLFGDSLASARGCLERACAGKQGHAFRYAVDVEIARYEGFEPLPFGSEIDFDRSAWLALFRARREAARRANPAVGGRHLLLGLLSLPDGLIGQALARLQRGPTEGELAETIGDRARSRLGGALSAGHRSVWRTTEHWDAVLRGAQLRAQGEGRVLVSEADLVIALLEDPRKVGEVFTQARVTVQQCLEAVQAVLSKGQKQTTWHSSGFDR